jgi:hypothetical protein
MVNDPVGPRILEFSIAAALLDSKIEQAIGLGGARDKRASLN